MAETMKVIVVKREGWHVHTVRVEISTKCPICGGPRGEPTWHNFCEDGDWLTCNVWTNPCGHVDLYKDVLIEAKQDPGIVETSPLELPAYEA